MMLLLWLILLPGLAFAGLFAAVCICAKLPRVPQKSDCILVLGARVRADGSLSYSLENRCRRALELYREGMARKLILCGGQGRNEPVSEAQAMRRYMLENGVCETDVLLEDRSRSTVENLANAREMMQTQGFETALVVTSDYHVQRTRWLVRDAGIRASFAAAASPGDGKLHIKARFQETESWILYFIRKIAK